MPNRNEILKLAEEWLTAHRQEMTNDLMEFVSQRSVSRADLAEPGAPFGAENAKMLEKALIRAAAYGFVTKNGDGYYGKATLGNDDRSIGIIAHLDVVPEGVNWTREPYKPVLEGDFLFGRGSGDNKGSAVMALYVMRMIRELDIPMKNGLRLIFGASEETGMQDMPFYNRMERPCKVTLVPDAAYPVCYAQKGSLNAHVSIPAGDGIISFTGGEVDNMVPPTAECVFRADVCAVEKALSEKGFSAPDYTVKAEGEYATVCAHGASAHAAGPEKGRSAIYMLSTALDACGLLTGESAKAVRAIASLSQGWYGEHMNIACEDADTGKTTMVVGVARTEKGRIALHIDCRLSVASDIPSVKENLRLSAEELGFALDFITTTEPSFMAKDDPRVRAIMDVYREITGDSSEPYTMGGGTYSRCLENAITFGLSFPGEKPRPENLPEGHGSAHSPDEYVHIPSLMKSAMIYLSAVLALDEIV